MRRVPLIILAAACSLSSCAPVPPAEQAVTSEEDDSPQIQVIGRSGPGFEPPTLARELSVSYPLEAQRRRESGVVTLRATVGMSGKLKNITATGDSNILIAAVTEAARKAEFNPARQDGIPVEVDVLIPITFTLSAMGEPGFSGAGVHTGRHTAPPPDESTRSSPRETPKGARR